MSMLLIEELPWDAPSFQRIHAYIYVHILCLTPLGSMNLGMNVLARRTAVPLAQFRFTKIYKDLQRFTYKKDLYVKRFKIPSQSACFSNGLLVLTSALIQESRVK